MSAFPWLGGELSQQPQGTDTSAPSSLAMVVTPSTLLIPLCLSPVPSPASPTSHPLVALLSVCSRSSWKHWEPSWVSWWGARSKALPSGSSGPQVCGSVAVWVEARVFHQETEPLSSQRSGKAVGLAWGTLYQGFLTFFPLDSSPCGTVGLRHNHGTSGAAVSQVATLLVSHLGTNQSEFHRSY